MRILVDGGTWTNRRGYGRFTREILGAAARIAGPHQLTMVIEASVRGDDVPEGVEVIRVRLGALPTSAASAEGHRGLADLWRMSRALSRPDADCVFFPSVYTYVPVLTRTPVVVCVHDVIAERLPSEVFPTRRSRAFWTMKTKAAMWQAARVVTVSEHARRGIADHFGVDPETIRIVPEAPSSVFSAEADVSPGREALATLGLPPDERFLLYVGGVAPHKNLLALVEAVASLGTTDASPRPTLLIVGDYTEDVFHSSYPALRAYLDRERLGGVHFTGALPDATVAALMRLAQALVLPSLDEGFGLPGIEAAACGTAVVATRHSALPDVLGDAALYFDPYVAGDLTRALTRVLSDRPLAAALGQRARVKASSLTWTAAAGRLMETIESLISSHSS